MLAKLYQTQVKQIQKSQSKEKLRMTKGEKARMNTSNDLSMPCIDL
jgi:hypothetical protein